MPALGHHLDEVTGAELECQVPPHAQDNYLLVEMPTPEEFLCGGRFYHPSRYRRKPSLSSLHQNHPLHVRREAGVVELLRPNGSQGPVLGIFEGARYQNCTSRALANDLIVLFTDGLFEVEVGTSDEYYGEERLLAAVRKRMRLPVGQLFAEVVAEIRQACMSGRFGDDVCILGMEVVRTGLAASTRLIA